ncbi:unnamed protein product [Closterium sp. NIES-64]|nr:unnamed protein product [Closterium sp. NIES-65]CAI5988346.1 unnamed protein product [Closterium sp. NIES-64]
MERRASSFFAIVLAAAVVLVCASARVEALSMARVGGTYTDVKGAASSDEIRSLAQWAIREINSKTGTLYSFVSVVSAQEELEVPSGSYRIKIKATDSSALPAKRAYTLGGGPSGGVGGAFKKIKTMLRGGKTTMPMTKSMTPKGNGVVSALITLLVDAVDGSALGQPNKLKNFKKL